MILEGFVGQAYVGTSPNVALESLVNWYPESVPVPEKGRVVYYPTPGKRTVVTLPTSPVRGLFSQDDLTFAIGGSRLYEVTASYTLIPRGILTASDANPATMSFSGTAGHQLYITSGGRGDVYDTKLGTLTPITAAGYPTQTAMGTYLDTYFLTTKGNSAQFNISDLLNGTAWSTLDFSVRIAGSDNLAGLIEHDKNIYLIGSRTSEVQYNSGAASFPFQAVPQTLIPTGTVAAFSIGRSSLGVHFLQQTEGGQGIFVRLEGTTPQRLSTFALEAEWSRYATLRDVVAYTYTEQGHEFIVLTFPSANVTWVYDTGLGLWHQRGPWNLETNSFDRDRGWVHCLANGVHLVGDWETGQIYEQATTITTEDDALMLRERTSPHLSAEHVTQFYSDFEVDVETGLGTTNGAGSDPTMTLFWSNDGHTWSNGLEMSLGPRGAYLRRCRAPGSLGSARDRVFRVRTSDPIPQRGLIQCYVTARPGTS